MSPVRSFAPPVLVLCYHAVSTSWRDPVAVHPDALRAQLRLLADAGYRSTTFTDAVHRQDDRVVCLTFDDAFRSTWELGLPVLEEFGMVGTVFVPTAFADSGRALSWSEYDDPARRPAEAEMAPLSWAQLRELADRGWEVGSHTRVHPHLLELDDDALAEELSSSREACAAGMNAPCTSLAYPYGEVDQRVRDAAEAAGYSAAAALGPQWRRGDRLWWPRVGVYGEDDLTRFRLKVTRLLRSRAAAVGITTARRVRAASHG